MTNQTTAPPPAVLADLSIRMRTDPSGRVTFLDDEGRPIIDADKPGCPDADGPAAARWLRSHHPELWPETPPTAPAAIAKLSGASTTAAHVPTKAAPQSVSELMAQARSGDPAAMAALNAALDLR